MGDIGEGVVLSQPVMTPPDDKGKYIGVRGKWYDVTDFIDKHPGGPVIERFIGRDATNVFELYHDDKILKYRKPLGTYTRTGLTPALRDFEKLHRFFSDNRYYDGDQTWYCKKYTVVFLLIAIAFHLVITYPDSAAMTRLAAVLIAFTYQQAGFLMHDFMHGLVFQNRWWDNLGGLLFGSVIFGVNAQWWKYEHNIHHVLTNTFIPGEGVTDPQAQEVVWAQNKRILDFFRNPIQKFLIKVQHITFLPMLVLIGRPAIIIDSMKDERKVTNFIAFFLSVAWTLLLVSYIPTNMERFIFLVIASSGEGILHVQLLISHYSKPFVEKENTHNKNFFAWQLSVNQNITNPWYTDWFHGGLNFHLEHHLFPRLPRHHYREASVRIKELCKRHGLPYDSKPFFATVWATLKHLKNVGEFVNLDPRK